MAEIEFFIFLGDRGKKPQHCLTRVLMEMCIGARERLLGLQETSVQACRSSRLCFGQLCGSHRALQMKGKLEGRSIFIYLFFYITFSASWW